MIAVVLDASAAVELLARTATGKQLAGLVPAGTVLWVPDGLFDVEVFAVLRRWELRGVISQTEAEACQRRYNALRLRRGAVASVRERAWQLRHNVTFSDACYVAMAERLRAPLLTSDERLSSVPNLPVPTWHP